MNERRATILAIGIALSAAVARLVPLGWLHPLNWDEIEFYRATRWIAEGRVPFRDFWEHHSPLTWFLFAPFSLLSDSPGVDAIISMRWAQIPVWIATFWLANLYMRNAGLPRFARWAAMSLALSSSFLMISAVEYRVDPVATALFVAGLVLVQRGSARAMFGAGVLFCLVGLANIRFGPLLVVTVLFLRVVDLRARAWSNNRRADWIFAGGFAALLLPLAYFAATRSFGAFWREVIVENFIGDKYAHAVVGQFFHRILVASGIRVIGADQLFDVAAIDAGGLALLLFGFAGLFLTVRDRWRHPDALFTVAVVQAVNLLIVARMRFIYNYHFQLPVILVLPLVAVAIARIPRRGWVIGALLVAWSVNLFASFFRGKELDLAYQDFVMREAHARTRPGENVFAGMGWALRREPAYRFFFLPELAKVLVEHGNAAPYRIQDILRDPPGVVIFDHSVKVWLTRVQLELAPYFVRHYIPVWRNLWIPGMNVRLRPQRPQCLWIVPHDGTYRLFASPALARHMWFRDPIYVGSYEALNVARTELTLGPPGPHPELQWQVDGQPVAINGSIVLRKGQTVTVRYGGSVPLGVILLSGTDTKLFRQPPEGANLEASTPRVTHVPHFGVRIEP
jgi:hypothetical protein